MENTALGKVWGGGEGDSLQQDAKKEKTLCTVATICFLPLNPSKAISDHFQGTVQVRTRYINPLIFHCFQSGYSKRESLYFENRIKAA